MQQQSDYFFREERTGAADAPLLFVFHGTGGDENQIFDLARSTVPEADIIAPRGDIMEDGRLRRFFRRKTEQIYDMEDVHRQKKRMAAFVARQIERLGAKRVIAIGYSNGANIIAITMMQDPDLFDAAVLMHPLIPFDPDPQPGLSGHRVLITAGRRDTICSVPNTERLEKWLRAQGTGVEMLWHEGGHEIRQEEIDAARRFFASGTA